MITGIDRIVYGVEDVERCTAFLDDFGLHRAGERDFETLDGAEIALRAMDDELPPAMEPGSTLRLLEWGVSEAAELAALREGFVDDPGYADDGDGFSLADPVGLRIGFRVSRRRDVVAPGSPMNTADQPSLRRNRRARVYERAEPSRVGHVVLFTDDVARGVAFYRDRLGFVVSDYYPHASFLRCRVEGGHHDLFLLQTPRRNRGLNHVAFGVRDIHEVFGGGLHMARCGWTTQLGPGRHPISSAYFWYFENPAGGLAEYYADEDWCTAQWEAREWQSSSENFAEWAIEGGIDGNTRRQAARE